MPNGARLAISSGTLSPAWRGPLASMSINDEQLIELVRQNPALYDFSDRKYMDMAFKLCVWNKIAAEMKEDASACKNRWTNIRDNYRHSLKKSANRLGQNKPTTKKMKMYKYSEQLTFLNKYFDERPAKGSIESQGEDDEEEEQAKPDEEDFVKEEPNPFLRDDQTHPELNMDLPSDEETSNCSRIPKIAKYRASLKRPQKTALTKLIEYLIKKNESNADQHPVDAFLAGIAPTLKNLNPYYLALAKSEIFSIAQKYEMQMIKQMTCEQDAAAAVTHSTGMQAYQPDFHTQ